VQPDRTEIQRKQKQGTKIEQKGKKQKQEATEQKVHGQVQWQIGNYGYMPR